MFMVIFIEKRKYICLLSVTRFEYDEYGRQLQIDDPSAGVRTYTYDTDGLPTGRSATRAGVTVFGQGYSFDAETGNLEERTDETRGLAEPFTYDHLNRLTGWQVQQGGTRTATYRMAYEANGNLTYLDGTGTLEYAHPRKPYAVTGVYAAGAIPEMGFEHEIEYTSFYRPASITSDTLVTSTATTPGATCATRKRWRLTPPAIC